MPRPAKPPASGLAAVGAAGGNVEAVIGNLASGLPAAEGGTGRPQGRPDP